MNILNNYRKAVYDACVETGIPVYDYWVVDIPFPYIIISQVESYSFDLKLNTKNEYTFVIDIFDKRKGKTGVVDYANEIATVLKGLNGTNIRIDMRHIHDVEPSVSHGIMTVYFTKYQ